MGAKQGQRYRVIAPPVPEGGRPPKINGTEVTVERYVSSFTDADGVKKIVTDLVGDIITSSENVEYPRGANIDYRNTKWIDEHPDRFELVEDTENPETETESE